MVAVFKEESRALAKLDSEHIVRVRRFGVTQEAIPRPFLVMFKLEGHTLLDALATLGRFSEADTVLYGIHIGLGLATAHAAGLVHRDIKPANIFLSKRKDPITGAWVTMATILDFGIARAASSGSPDSARLPVICSHPYCCPTQYQGRAFPQSDLYALGVTMFLMLTRDHPLGNIVSDREWVRAKLVDRPKPQLVNEVIRELNLLRGPKKQKIALVDPELEDLLDRCLAYDPEDRPGTAEAFVRSLEIIHERIKARREAEEDATLTQQGFTPAPRGAKTVPEPYEWMRKRVSAEIARSGQGLPGGEPEVVETPEEATERLERSRAIEQAVAGLPLDSPPLTDAEVEAIRAGRGERAPQTVPKDVRQHLVLAGSTLESPQAAQRSMRKHSTSGGRVTFALGADKTPVMAPDLLPQMQPREPAVQNSQRRGFTAANSSLVELPVSRLWLWKERAAALLRDVKRPKRGKHWRSIALFVSAGFALATALVVLGVSLFHSFGGSATAEPKVSGPTANLPPTTTTCAKRARNLGSRARRAGCTSSAGCHSCSRRSRRSGCDRRFFRDRHVEPCDLARSGRTCRWPRVARWGRSDGFPEEWAQSLATEYERPSGAGPAVVTAAYGFVQVLLPDRRHLHSSGTPATSACHIGQAESRSRGIEQTREPGLHVPDRLLRGMSWERTTKRPTSRSVMFLRTWTS